MHTSFNVPATGEVSRARSYGILSTFPPTSCGLATFSAALAAGLIANGATVDVVRCEASPDLDDALVVAALGAGTPGEVADAIDALNATDVAIVQHEYGIYAGPDGDAVVGLMAQLVVPTILVAHTVVTSPSPNQRRVLERLCAMADVVVVMTGTARARLVAGYRVEPSKVVVVPHGAATPTEAGPSIDRRDRLRPPRLLTWGLLGPGKGVEWAIDAMAMLDEVHPHPHYLVAGATHPKVRQRSGEAYREMLVARAAASRCAPWITFDDTYRDLVSLTALIRSADVVVLPYDSTDQVTSGVLVDAVAAGRPVVSTAFPHAIELLASGAGIVVPQRDPQALATAIRAVLTDSDLAASMTAEARRLAPGLSWAAVGLRYEQLASDLVVGRHAAAS